MDKISLQFPSRSENEAFARTVAAAFAARLDPTLDQVAELRTAVSEAVTNAIIHGYAGGEGTVEMTLAADDKSVTVEVIDRGCGIEDIEKAREPFYTSRPDLERSGMGFTVMEALTDEMLLESTPGQGTKVTLRKVFQGKRP